MGPVANATRVMDKASVSILHNTQVDPQKNCRAASCSGWVHLLNRARIAEQRTDQGERVAPAL